MSETRPKRPTGAGWKRQKIEVPINGPYEVWVNLEAGLMVVSAIEDVRDRGPEFHLSISFCGTRPPAATWMWALSQFGITEASEDNGENSNGMVSHFWIPISSGEVLH